MAITVNIKRGSNTYNSLHAGSIDSVIVATSDNYSEPNFRYVVYVRLDDPIYGNNTELTFFVQPNPQGRGVFNLRQLFMEHKSVVNVPAPSTAYPFIFYPETEINDRLTCFTTRIDVYEGWDVGNIFTEDPDSNGGESFKFRVNHGLRNNLLPAIARVDSNSTAFTDVLPNTFYDRVKHLLPPNLRGGYTYLVANEDDQGVIVFDADEGGLYNTANDSNIFLVTYDFYDEDGTLLGTKYSDDITPGAGTLVYAQGYPSNVSTFIGWYTGTAFYTIRLQVQGLMYDLSTTYLMVIEPNNCRYDKVRLAWIGENGGFEYFNFPLKNERTYSTDRKQYIKPYGNYGTIGLGISETDAGDFGPDLRDVRNLVNREATINTVLDITSDWLTETEFNYLKSLLIAEHIYILTNVNGEFKTVVIDDKNYLERRERSTKKYNLKLQLRYGQIYQAIDYQLLPPPPVPCAELPGIYHQGATKITDISTQGELPIVYQCNDWGVGGGGNYVPRFSNPSYNVNEVGYLVTGQIYKIEVTLSDTLPGGTMYLTFGRHIQSYGYDDPPLTAINGNTTATQTFYLPWNPNNLTGPNTVFGCLVYTGRTNNNGYFGQITINIYSGGCL